MECLQEGWRQSIRRGSIAEQARASRWPTPCPIRLPRAAGDIERFAGDPRRIVRGEEDGGRGDVVRLADPAERRLCSICLRKSLSAMPGGVDALGLDHAGVDRVDADLARPQLLGERLGSRRRRPPWCAL